MLLLTSTSRSAEVSEMKNFTNIKLSNFIFKRDHPLPLFIMQSKDKEELRTRIFLLLLTASIRIWRSGSGICWPSLCKPVRSCSRLILPLFPLSIIWNASFIPATSSTDKCSAMTYKRQIQISIDWKKYPSSSGQYSAFITTSST